MSRIIFLFMYVTPHTEGYEVPASEREAPEAGAPEIEITPAMIEAGATLISDYFGQPIDWLTRERASLIFAGMLAERT